MARRKPAVHIHLPSTENKGQPKPPQPEEGIPNAKHRSRIKQFRERWQNIKEDLPPQFTRRHSESMLLLKRIVAALKLKPNP